MEPAASPAAWQRTPAAWWLALLLGVVPMYALAIFGGLAGLGKPFKVPSTVELVTQTVLSVAVFGGSMLCLLYFVCGEKLSDLQSQPSAWPKDLQRGVVLWLSLTLAMIAIKPLLTAAGAPDVPEANQALGVALAHNPQMLAVFFGPVIWLQAALLEEFSRVFMLTRLWQIFPHPAQRVPVLIASSVLFGAGHLWEGWQGVASITLVGLLLGWNYMRCGRVLPLMLAHGLFDTAAGIMLVLVGKGVIKV